MEGPDENQEPTNTHAYEIYVYFLDMIYETVSLDLSVYFIIYMQKAAWI